MEHLSPPSSSAIVNLVVRFASSLPDLSLPQTNLNFTTALSLQTRIRETLPAPFNVLRLRLIYSGRVLPSTAPLTSTIRVPSPPPPSLKGKAPLAPPPTLYVHCSLSEPALTSTELENEAIQGSESLRVLLQASSNASSLGKSLQDGQSNGYLASRTNGVEDSSAATSARPVGFDRLLSAGLTPFEVASLRSEFLAIQAHSHTPETMPSAATLRQMEDRWLDNDSGTGPSAAGDGATGESVAGLGISWDDGDHGALDDMLWGSLAGFFWPVGAVVWVLREEGIWSKRRQLAVLAGMGVNLLFSILRWG